MPEKRCPDVSSIVSPDSGPRWGQVSQPRPGVADAGCPRLGSEGGDVAKRGERDDFDLPGQFAGDLEGGGADGTGGP